MSLQGKIADAIIDGLNADEPTKIEIQIHVNGFDEPIRISDIEELGLQAIALPEAMAAFGPAIKLDVETVIAEHDRT